MFEATVKCAQCGKPFAFCGLPPGVNSKGAATSFDALEVRVAMLPLGERAFESNIGGVSIGYTVQ